MIIQLGGRDLELRPSGAVLVGATLVVADLHLGKERAFRKLGVPVPEGPTADSLAALESEVMATGAKRVIFLGDLFHHEIAIEGATFEKLHQWLCSHPDLTSQLVKGNHDRIPHHLRNRLEVVERSKLGEIALSHFPGDPDEICLAGHLHPAIRIHQGRRSERLRCFWQRGNGLVLPSFSTFTGCATIDPSPGDSVFVMIGKQVRKVGG